MKTTGALTAFCLCCPLLAIAAAVWWPLTLGVVAVAGLGWAASKVA